ncbi:MAG TPA: bifunctional 2-polyprenyl-6-hydroxyphenol methylase/3-demethylubiquinol 3-O-methyltransferase UbiG [Aquimonas sp.]|jgi:2-polyprenyl-6-hydroxyphenyl methylase / 3-demethylubiquinone-9 3-methyltransferase|nr:bifunctional 2-polyprenyl-6-hydroxyphenol methylase/3-demethylubiquinol 3-O-methyltransferase UbiG [Xanthomonadales bacterium]HRD71486.1 bifunctional 2-polyprenyl-6-hydroxyphenol methylase/3-demethylubiquinol 3-O-methyltransferase UbiG [Aquimonas sp.]HRF52920.1 bifunctional 2-polyprenyl-6-hydroxyphenol methylase/3-demethylubiquinol 3-O-methyltransferase UbiG [Aquimonas sp.]
MQPNVDPAALAQFERLAARWWDPDGESRALHDLNPARLGYVMERVELRGKAVLDVGCGGGLLSEALAAQSAKVTGIDLAPAVLETARLHLYESGLQIEYLERSAEALAAERPQQFDVITCMEMLEHVPDPAAIVEACADLLKPGGWLFLSTLNRTPQAFALAIAGAEYVMRLLPKGTHRYAQFIRPSELASALRAAALQLEDVSGLQYNPFTRAARVGGQTGINYLVAARKPS